VAEGGGLNEFRSGGEDQAVQTGMGVVSFFCRSRAGMGRRTGRRTDRQVGEVGILKAAIRLSLVSV